MNEFVTRLEWNGMMTVLERIEAKLESHDRYFHAINATLGSMDRRFERLEEMMHHQNMLCERLESKLDAVIEIVRKP